MRLEVDGAKWHTRRQRGPVRPQSVENQQKTIRQVNNMTEARVIKPSQATEFIHAKTKWQEGFCINFRMFNLYCMRNGWPIPNIDQMIHRIGHTRPQYFGVVDLTRDINRPPHSRKHDKYGFRNLYWSI